MKAGSREKNEAKNVKTTTTPPVSARTDEQRSKREERGG
jgi:hypothetical protein